MTSSWFITFHDDSFFKEISSDDRFDLNFSFLFHSEKKKKNVCRLNTSTRTSLSVFKHNINVGGGGR